MVTRTEVATTLTIVGVICFLVFMWKGIWESGGYGSIAACIISLFALFGGGILFSPSSWKFGLIFTACGLGGTISFGLFSWAALSTVKSMDPEYVFGFILFLICCTLAGISLAFTINGLGMLYGSLTFPRK